MAQISVGYTDDGVVVLVIVDPDRGINMKAPMLPHEAHALGENLIDGAKIVRGLIHPKIITLPHQ